ncbi:MAG: peptidoglycan DD-metalloendopeptidase family protein [Acidobacteriota bacterium]|nr:MAG: peptidoglycan DD-metalloendopeptidase family protein [Acidobacteriota bacterium]
MRIGYPVLFLIPFLAAPVVGETGASEPAPVRKDKLEQEIARLTAERARLLREEQGVLDRLEVLAADARLLDAKIERIAIQQQASSSELDALQEQISVGESQLAQSRERLRRTVLLLHRLGPLGRLRPLLDAPDADRLAAGLRLAHELTVEKKRQTTVIRDRLSALTELTDEAKARGQQLQQLAAQAQQARRRLSQIIRSRQQLLADLRTQRDVRTQAIAELARGAEQLARLTGIGESPARLDLDVRKFRRLLPMPVAGQVVTPYGEHRDRRFGTVLPHPGWDIDASFGAEVRAIFDAEIAWTGWLRAYGLVIVLDHGQGVHSVVSHLSAVLVEERERIEQGQVVGLVGDTGSLRGPYLYFEMRENGRAVDPSMWVDRSRPVTAP